jgi:hypothetical protein
MLPNKRGVVPTGLPQTKSYLFLPTCSPYRTLHRPFEFWNLTSKICIELSILVVVVFLLGNSALLRFRKLVDCKSTALWRGVCISDAAVVLHKYNDNRFVSVSWFPVYLHST